MCSDVELAFISFNRVAVLKRTTVQFLISYFIVSFPTTSVMEQHLFILLFFTGVVPLTLSVPRKYYLIQQGKRWSDAQVYCKTNHADMAIIESNDNMIQLQNEAQRVQFSSSAWIGLYNDINSWRWSFGNEPLGSVKKWAGVEPNNSGGNQQCVALLTTGWTDRICTEALPFVCFDGEMLHISQQ
ncbi:C-type lectin domain family 10 member A-like [Ictalurus furcatus]|uniref:C-type lectin domain family 10 member A-like n=1 Tax=Ictalurus furcatus TaxID=66913 RepID=UPI00234FFA5A|nr:C-type lectin domain family 10 member A-like [Ictalurus furcatus]